MNWGLIWMAVKVAVKNWYYLIRIFPQMVYLLLTYYPMLWWYMVFTPKDAEYIEDIPRLKTKQDEIESFKHNAMFKLLLSQSEFLFNKTK